MGFAPQRGMGYGLLQTYELWVQILCELTWWTQKTMGYRSLWVIRSMGYEGVDCITLAQNVVLFYICNTMCLHDPYRNN